MKFDLPKDQASIIKVFGVGGGGSNAVNHMYNQGITGVDFVICNTDAQALNLSPVPNKIQLGTTLTEGLGAGANPEVGKNAAIEDIENIKAILEKNTKMVFITAGMGGGTGSGAAPIIAEAARDLGILTVGIVTIPFSFEGRRRKQQADEGLAELKKHVDTLLVINNDKLRMMHGNLKMGEAFSKADDILTIAAKGIAEIITVAGYINVDFEDVRTVMKNGGTAIMGSAEAEGENRAMEAVTKALASPLLNDNEIKGANFILLNVTSGENEITMDEIDEITDYIQNEAGYTAELIWGNGIDLSLGNKVSVTVIATGFGVNNTDNFEFGKKVEKKVFDLNTDVPTTITQIINDGSVEQSNAKITGGVEEPTLKQQVEEQPTLDFETPTQQVVEEEKVVFNLNEDIEEEDFVAENEDTSWNWNKVNVAETEESDEEDEFVFNEKSFEDTIEEEKIELESNTIVWNLHDDQGDDSSAEFEASSSDTNQIFDKEEDKITPVYTNKIPNEEQIKRSQERINKIRELGMKMKTPSGINDLENEPAYKRRKINLGEIPHSSENLISRFTLSEDKDGVARLNDDNSFLHDNVD